ncbi:sodium/potassium/calcium exchanger 3-like isoform X2 [Scleropages formosus]|uniref:sodium/potassium/calcium exchanger 3-like isoform X2 n=1 Tax=Scleropages formosus TaxID=113540 RepID=UPI0010FA9DEC|nr:sodium/potassium/calcium exchanger 3-like isoform X2 [Scleropages formosus]
MPPRQHRDPPAGGALTSHARSRVATTHRDPRRSSRSARKCAEDLKDLRPWSSSSPVPLGPSTLESLQDGEHLETEEEQRPPCQTCSNPRPPAEGMLLLVKRRRRRKEILGSQMGFAGVLLLLSWRLSCRLDRAGYAVSNAPLSERGRWDGRKLLQEPGSNGTLEQEENCTTPALHEFPRDLFSPQERTRGALLLHVLCVSLLRPYENIFQNLF